MGESIEKTVLKILDKVSEGEKSTNKALSQKTLRVLKALAYLKAEKENKKLGA